MNDPAIVFFKTEEGDLRFVKKDKTFVDKLTEECIMGYVEASEKESPLRSKQSVRIITLKTFVLNNINLVQDIIEKTC